MRTIFSICGLILLVGGFLLWRSFQLPTKYGTFTGAPRVEIADVVNHPQDYMHKVIALEGVVAKQCTTMGCYFFFIHGSKEIRVDIAEIAMNAPRKRDGRRARVEGQVVPYDQGYQVSASAVEFQ